jgi:alkylation response protein AidB-like acyl-CoA dehydrogenase
VQAVAVFQLRAREQRTNSVLVEMAGVAMTVTDSAAEVGRLYRGPQAADYLARARALVPLVESEADEAEQQRTVTVKVAQALREAGLPWMLVPQRLGGGGLRIADCVEVIETIAAADGSVGLILQAYAIGNGLWSGFLTPAVAEQLFLSDDKKTICGTPFPPGRATLVDGGVRVTGRWPFGTGAMHADYILGGVAVHDGEGNPRLNPDGGPEMRLVFMAKDDVTLEGNWDVSGMVGTASQDFAADEVFVPEELAPHFIGPTTEPYQPDGMFRIGLFPFTVPGHAAVALGLMRRALREVATHTQAKQRSGYPTPVDEYPVFLSEFAQHEARYQSARAYLLNSLREAQDYADREGSTTPELASRIRQAATYAHEVAEPLVSFARLWAGTKGFREPSPLARVGRDLAVAATHVQVDPITMVEAAPALLDSWKSR